MNEKLRDNKGRFVGEPWANEKPKLCECGCGKMTTKITHTCKKNGRIKGNYSKFIEGHNSRINNPRKLNLDIENIKKLYLVERKNVYEIAKILCCSSTFICSILKKENIPGRSYITRFQKGCKPINGFKKGNISHNKGKTKENYEPLRRASKKISMKKTKVILSEENMNFLKNNYLIMSNVELGKKLGLSNKYVCNKLRKLNLKRDSASLKKIKSRIMSEENSPLYNKPVPKERIDKISTTKRRKYATGEIKSWQTGLTKETDERLKIMGEKHSKSLREKYNRGELPKNIGGVGEYNPMYRKHHTEKSKQKIREKTSGENHYNWRGGIAFDPYDKNFNRIFKKFIKERDGCCLMCNISIEDLHLMKRKLSTHHIDYNKNLSIPQNCVILCNKCHGKTNINRQHWTKFFQSLLSERYGYKYSEDGKIILETKET